jgi:hypothetical protein
MKKLIIASACILALSAGGAFAQTQPAPGASSEGNVGPGATKSPKHMKTSSSTHIKKGTTTGMSSGKAHRSKGMSANPSSEGNVGPGTTNTMGKQPGGR